jgi:plasmid maintenance system antidote protein VapI
MKDQVRAPTRLRVVTPAGRLRKAGSGYRSGRSSVRETPESCSSARTRSAGTPLRRHLSTACGEILNDAASDPTPHTLIARSTLGLNSMFASQPQVEQSVNLGLVANLNLGFHPLGMSPIGKVILKELKRLDRTQAWLAEQVGVSENAVSKWIATGKMSRANMAKVAPLLGVSSDQLLNPSETDELDREWRKLSRALKARLIAIVHDIRGAGSEDEPEERPRRRGQA